MLNWQNFIIKAISIGFFVHFIQWLMIGIKSGGLGPASFYFLISGCPSLVTAVSLWKAPNIGIPIAIIRSMTGIYFAIGFGHFLTFKNALIPDVYPPFIWTWPSVFFLISIIFLVFIAVTGNIYRNKSSQNANISLNRKFLPNLIVILLGLGLIFSFWIILRLIELKYSLAKFFMGIF